KIGSAIADSSVPFPDVWIPFNDSLRMLAGYGDDIKVGDYTVATQASFSRASTATYIDKSGVLRTAAINEPRFEKEGLLIEGQSTNLVPKSEGWPGSTFVEGAWTHSAKDAEGFITVDVKTVTTAPEGTHVNFSLGTTGVHTFSIDVKKTPNLYVIIRFYGNAAGSSGRTIALRDTSAAGYTAGVVDMGSYWRVAMSDDFNAAGTKIARVYPAGDGGTPSGSMTYRRVQLEALPFATSYIPTNGAAATRAGDFCSIKAAGNYSGYATYAASISNAREAGSNVGRIIWADANGISFDGVRINTDGELALFLGNAADANKLVFGSYVDGFSGVLAFQRGGVCRSGDVLKTAPNVPLPSVTPSNIRFGHYQNVNPIAKMHIRNFRIWHRALTDAQIKGLK
ncbi:MAG: phage head spike fiber domain-containing protein, partial [Aeromonas veronii]